jgi:hypothetical protein
MGRFPLLAPVCGWPRARALTLGPFLALGPPVDFIGFALFAAGGPSEGCGRAPPTVASLSLPLFFEFVVPV